MARKRRGRGEGSVYQRGDGVWSASYSAGYDGAGKRRRKSVYGKTKAEVQEKLRKLQNDGPALMGNADQLTVTAFLKKWLAAVKPTVEPNTYGPYRRHCDLHIAPVLGGVKVSKLSRIDVEQFYAALTDKGMSAVMRRKVGTTLSTALNHAVEKNLISFNPASGIRKPKAQKPDIKVLDPDLVGIFLKAAGQDRLFAFYVTALDTGGRPGELFALTWEDVNLDGGHITISKSLEDIAGNLRVKEVKTKRGRRRIDISERTVQALQEHRKRMLAGGHISGPVFCDTTGGHLRITNLRKNSLVPLLRRAGLPDLTFYSLRHTSATLLLLADVNPKIVSERLGHASVQLTLDTYSHVLPTMQRSAAEKMSRILGNT
jgi:integrase